jgi:SAM-dependent methyltransferase
VRVADSELLTVNVSSATVAILSLPLGMMDHVGAKLKREMRPGARIVSRQFSIGNWKPDRVSRTADGTPLFLWTVPRRPAREPDILFVPTREAVADRMLQLAGITSEDIVYDLGSGDGRIVNLAAQKYGARGVGIEIDPPLIDIARQVAREAGVTERATFIEADLFTADLSRATIVTIYLSPGVNRKLEPKLRKELRPGTRVVSHQFTIGDWKPDRTVRADDGTDLYLWTVR